MKSEHLVSTIPLKNKKPLTQWTSGKRFSPCLAMLKYENYLYQ